MKTIWKRTFTEKNYFIWRLVICYCWICTEAQKLKSFVIVTSIIQFGCNTTWHISEADYGNELEIFVSYILILLIKDSRLILTELANLQSLLIHKQNINNEAGNYFIFDLGNNCRFRLLYNLLPVDPTQM